MAVNMLSCRMPPGKFIKYWLPVIIYAIVIFYFSSIPGRDIPGLFAYQDTVFHIIEYAGFALLIARALKACMPQLRYPQRFLWVVLAALLYALSDELHQYFVPGRCVSFADVFCDGMAAVVTNIFYR